MRTKKFSILIIFIATLTLTCSCNNEPKYSPTNENIIHRVNLRLLWYPQAQFAGYIVAKEKGFYSKRGMEVTILPAGPDLKPHVTVASGVDHFGISVPNSIILSRNNGVPLLIVSQMFQDSPNRYILKRKNSIKTLQELKGKKVGLWLGGDEAEFVSMLHSANMTTKDITIIPQEYSVIPFLEDQYVLSMVTTYNELLIIIDSGIVKDDLQIISPADYNSAIPGDLLFTTDDYANKYPDVVSAFREASIEGWIYCINNRSEAIDILLKINSNLDRQAQIAQLDQVISLLQSDGLDNIGKMDINKYRNTLRILQLSGQIDAVNFKLEDMLYAGN